MPVRAVMVDGSALVERQGTGPGYLGKRSKMAGAAVSAPHSAKRSRTVPAGHPLSDPGASSAGDSEGPE